LSGRRVLEAGCGDGSYLAHLAAAGADASGVEPSSRFRALARERGFRVEEGYVTAERRLEAGPFSAFVTRQVLEHVPQIHDFLTGIRENLEEGAVGLVEVPSLEKALQDRRYYDFFPDHVNYFSLRTLRLALEMNGFEVLDSLQDMFDEYNVAIVRRIGAPSLADVEATVGSLSRELLAFVRDHKARGGKVAIWGAGGKGLSVLAAGGIRDIDLLVDSDPNKQGLITPVSHLRVQAPEALASGGFTAVVITAMAYRHEIEKTLRDRFGFGGEIAVLGHHLEVARAAGRQP
jgi:SAM-dependent methyltransferase